MENSEKYNVLYVDDEQDNILVFRSAFRRYYNVYTATSAAEGVEILKETLIPVIITDQRMPQITGVEFLKSLPDTPENMRMILSGYSDMKDIIDAINQAKIFRYISKPWSFDELKQTIEEAIAEWETKRKLHNKVNELDNENKSLKAALGEFIRPDVSGYQQLNV